VHCPPISVTHIISLFHRLFLLTALFYRLKAALKALLSFPSVRS
jgi:hypothetical protein